VAAELSRVETQAEAHPVAKIQLNAQMIPKAGGLPLVYDLIFLKET
jgi:hypothetical protein